MALVLFPFKVETEKENWYLYSHDKDTYTKKFLLTDCYSNWAVNAMASCLRNILYEFYS